MASNTNNFAAHLSSALVNLQLKLDDRECGYRCYEFDSMTATQGRTLGPHLGQLVVFDGLDDLGITSLTKDYGYSSRLREVALASGAFDVHLRRLKTPLPPVPIYLVDVLREINGFHHAGGLSLCGVQVPLPKRCTGPMEFMALNVFENYARRSHELVIGTVVNTDRSVLFLNTLNGRVEQRLPHGVSVLREWDDVCDLVLEATEQSVK